MQATTMTVASRAFTTLTTVTTLSALTVLTPALLLGAETERGVTTPNSAEQDRPTVIAAGSDEICECDDEFASGDRVCLLVDHPDGNHHLFAGDMGTVLCANETGPQYLLVTWDDFADGHDGNRLCICPIIDLEDDSGWYMECHEIAVKPPPPDPCPADFDDDGSVGLSDLMTLLTGFGDCPGGGEPCPLDLNGDGVVNTADLAVLLFHYGPCMEE